MAPSASEPPGTPRGRCSGTRGKGCYYGAAGLSGAAAWNDVPTFCNGTSRTISAGSYPTSWTPEPQPPVCERGNPNTQRFDAGPPTTPYAGCYNIVESRCYPCCPSTPTNCSDKPDGYPGYYCVPSNPDYCACRCEGGKWQCGC